MKGMSVCHINNELDLNTVRRTSKKNAHNRKNKSDLYVGASQEKATTETGRILKNRQYNLKNISLYVLQFHKKVDNLVTIDLVKKIL